MKMLLVNASNYSCTCLIPVIHYLDSIGPDLHPYVHQGNRCSRRSTKSIKRSLKNIFRFSVSPQISLVLSLHQSHSSFKRCLQRYGCTLKFGANQISRRNLSFQLQTFSLNGELASPCVPVMKIEYKHMFVWYIFWMLLPTTVQIVFFRSVFLWSVPNIRAVWYFGFDWLLISIFYHAQRSNVCKIVFPKETRGL